MMTLRQFKAGLESVPIVAADYLQFLGEARGHQELFTRQSPQQLKTLRDLALVESAVSSNRIEGVEVEHSRVGTLVFGKPKPRDRPEEELIGYRAALELIHREGSNLAISTDSILRLHKLMRGEIGDAGKFKEKAEPIIERFPDGRFRIRFMPLEASETPQALAELAELWNDNLKTKAVPPLIALAAFNLDFLCIHPFRDGNGRVSRLLLLLQSYHLGFEVGRYISLERLIEQNKERYYETLQICSEGWHEGNHDPWPYIHYLLFILKSAYKEFESRLGDTSAPRGSKTQRVQGAIESFAGEFTVSDIERICPGTSRELIRNVLREHQREGRLICLGRGPGAKWKKTGQGQKRDNTLKRG